jgi:hypothetical protein
VDLPVSDEDDWEDGEESDEEDVKGSSKKKKAKQHVDQLKRLQEKVRLLSIPSSGFCAVLQRSLILQSIISHRLAAMISLASRLFIFI